MKYAFHGAFAPYIYGLIEKKRSLGYDYYESERILRTFDEFCREQFPCETNLTSEIAMRWAEQTGTEQNLFRLNTLRADAPFRCRGAYRSYFHTHPSVVHPDHAGT